MSSPAPGSVTHGLGRLKAGDHAIAKKLGRTTRSVERKLQMIRRKLQQMAEE
jgi:hypothetical protein